VRAGIVTTEHLAGFRWCSLRKFLKGERWAGLTGDLVMPFWGLLDDARGWASYEERLRDLAGDPAEQRRLGFEEFSKGWAIGTAGWRAMLAKQLSQTELAGVSRQEARGVREDQWRATLDAKLSELGKVTSELGMLKPRQRAEPWRMELATQLRAVGAPYTWIAGKLGFPKVDSLRVRLNGRF